MSWTPGRPPGGPRPLLAREARKVGGRRLKDRSSPTGGDTEREPQCLRDRVGQWFPAGAQAPGWGVANVIFKEGDLIMSS